MISSPCFPFPFLLSLWHACYASVLYLLLYGSLRLCSFSHSLLSVLHIGYFPLLYLQVQILILSS